MKKQQDSSKQLFSVRDYKCRGDIKREDKFSGEFAFTEEEAVPITVLRFRNGNTKVHCKYNFDTECKAYEEEDLPHNRKGMCYHFC